MTPSVRTSGVLVQSPVSREQWERALAQDEYAMADHSPAWIEALCADGRYRDATRGYRFADGREFVLPMVERASSAGRWLLSPPPAWGFGGLVGEGVDSDVVRMVVRDLRSIGAMRVSIRPDPLRADAWALPDERAIIRIPRYAHAVDLEGGYEAVQRGFSKDARRGIRTATKAGVTIVTDTTGRLLTEHYALYLTSIERWARRQREPLALARWRAQRRDPLSKLQAMAAALGDRFCQHVAYHDGMPVASSIVVLGASAHDTRGAMDHQRASRVRANDLLQAHALRHAVDYGCRYYHLGESGGSTSLAHFKEKFGALGYAYEEVRLERLPLTSLERSMRTSVKRVIGFRDA